MRRIIIPYNPQLKLRAREFRNNPTPAEKRLWIRLKGRQVRGHDFHRQRPIGRFIVDFYCSELLLAIELDGGIHDETKLRDGERQQWIENRGVRFIRFTNKEVFDDINGVIDDIARWIDEYGWTRL